MTLSPFAVGSMTRAGTARHDVQAAKGGKDSSIAEPNADAEDDEKPQGFSHPLRTTRPAEGKGAGAQDLLP